MAGEIAVQEPVVEQEAVAEVTTPVEITSETPSAQTETTQAQEKSWQEQIDEIRQKVGDEEFVKHPVVNARAQSIAAKQRKQWEQEQRQQQERVGLANQWENWWKALPEQQRLAHAENATQEFLNVQEAKKVLKSGHTVDAQYVAQNIVSNLEEMLREDETFTDADFEKLKTEYANDPAGWLKSLVKHGVTKSEKKIPELVKAAVAAELAKRAKGIEAVENGPELQGPGSSTKHLSDSEFLLAYGEGDLNSSADRKRAAEILARQRQGG